jgi:transcriptional regulator with XRE-family HTH domain
MRPTPYDLIRWRQMLTDWPAIQDTRNTLHDRAIYQLRQIVAQIRARCTQPKFAERCGYGQGTVSSILCGRKRPRLDTTLAMLEAACEIMPLIESRALREHTVQLKAAARDYDSHEHELQVAVSRLLEYLNGDCRISYTVIGDQLNLNRRNLAYYGAGRAVSVAALHDVCNGLLIMVEERQCENR